MSEKSQLHRFGREPKVLVIGQVARTLELVIDEVRAAGIDVRGMSPSEADGAINGLFDLVAFGGAVTQTQQRSLEREILFHNPRARFLKVYGPYAASQIVAAARNEDIPSVDLAAYFDRIGYSGPAEPTLPVLRSLNELHPAAIPFEAIDVLLDRGIDISPAAVDAKLIDRRRGGYCFEQNGLFARVLKSIGFEVDGMVASVRWMAQHASIPAPFTHRVNRVMIDGVPWLADVGFGSCVPTAPVRMDIAEPQPTQHEMYRVVPMGEQKLVQALIDDRWQPVYCIGADPWLDSHYELANWYSSTHPASHFRHRLIVTRTTPEARHILSDGRLTIRHPDGSSEKRYLDAGEIMEELERTFLLPVSEDWQSIARRAEKAIEAERLAEAA